MYTKTTGSITVSVKPIYLADESSPEQDTFFWAYQVEITNNGQETVQLTHRHWMITDAMGRVSHVEGEGVVGEQPVLRPGQSFEYASGTPLSTPSGIMVGTYRLVQGDGHSFEVDIPAFSLDSPYQPIRLN